MTDDPDEKFTVVLPTTPQQRAVFASIRALFIGGNGGVAVVPRTREDEVVELLGTLAARLEPRQSEPRADVKKRKLLKVREVAEVLGISRSAAYRIVNSALTHVAVGERGKRVPLEALDRFIRKNMEDPACPPASTPRSPAARSTAGTSTSAARPSTAASRRRTAEPPSSPSGASSEKPTLRPVFPKTRPRGR